VFVSRRPRSEASHAAWMILGLLAIPVLSVTSTAMVADVASSTDPATAAVGIPATLGGVVMGSLVFRLARAMHSGAIALRGFLFAAPPSATNLLEANSSRLPLVAMVRPALVLVPSRVGRRGPPVVVR